MAAKRKKALTDLCQDSVLKFCRKKKTLNLLNLVRFNLTVGMISERTHSVKE